jgi:hypothetical protein
MSIDWKLFVACLSVVDHAQNFNEEGEKKCQAKERF